LLDAFQRFKSHSLVDARCERWQYIGVPVVEHVFTDGFSPFLVQRTLSAQFRRHGFLFVENKQASQDWVWNLGEKILLPSLDTTHGWYSKAGLVTNLVDSFLSLEPSCPQVCMLLRANLLLKMFCPNLFFVPLFELLQSDT